MRQTSTLFNCKGTRIHAVEQGRGPLVILLHGFPESWYSWRHQVPALAEAGYRVVAVDQRGYGRSSKYRVQTAYRIKELAGDVAALIEACGEKSAVVIGHDWGAPVAWTFAWMRPDLCRGVVGLSVPFSARGQIALPGCPFGEQRPDEYHRIIAGAERVWYQDYFSEQDGIIREIEEDLRRWMLGLIYTVSGEPVGAGMRAAAAQKLSALDIVRHGPLCMPAGAKLRDAFVYPEKMPSWLSEADLDFFVGEFERSGFGGPLSFYHNLDNNWHDLADLADRKLTPPAMFIGGQYDVATIWGEEAIARAGEWMPDYRGSYVVPGAGHWIQQEAPEETNRLLIEFLHALR